MPERVDPLSGDAVADLLRRLVAVPSVNPSLAASGQGEAAAATLARDWLRRQGVAANLEEALPGRPNVHAEVGAGSGPALCLYAHLDTVDVAGMDQPFAPVEADGRLYGRGAYDMKGGAAAVMSAAAALAGVEGLPCRVTLALVADEEYTSAGTEAYLRRHRPDACIVTEPTDGALVLGHKGFCWVEATTSGRAAHGSRWDLGRSAIAAMGPVIAALTAFDRDVLRRRTHPLLGPASLHCAVISGGSGVSTYADRCELKVERRLIPGEDAEGAGAELSDVVRRAAPDAAVRLVFARPPLLCDPAWPVVAHVRAAVAEVTGSVPADSGTGGWLDAALFAAAGVPVVVYGPSGAGAHERVEWVDLDSVVALAHVLVAAARRFGA